MASESWVTDQIIDEHEEKKVGDDNKCDGEGIIFQRKEAAGKDGTDKNEEGLRGTAPTTGVLEETHEPDGVSVSDETKKEERHEKLGEATISLQESGVSNSSEPAVETNEGKMQSQAYDAHETPSDVQKKSSEFVQSSAFQEPMISESKTVNEKKPDEAPLVSSEFDASEDGNIESETQEEANLRSAKDTVGIELIKSEDSMDAVLAPPEFPTVVVPYASEAREKNDTDSSTSTSIEEPVKDLEVESGFPEESKSEGSTKTKEPEKQGAANLGSSKDKVDIKLTKSEDFMDAVQELAPDEFPIVVVPCASEAPEKNDVYSSTSTSIEEPVKDLEVESGFPEEHKYEGSTKTKEPETQEAANLGSSKDKVDIKLTKSEDFMDAVQGLAPDEFPIVVVLCASEAPEKNDVYSSTSTSIEEPVKDLEVESCFPEEHKSEGSKKTKEPETQEAANLGPSKDKVDIKLTKSEDFMDAVQELAPDEFPIVVVPCASEEPEKNDVDSSTSTSTKVPVKDLEVESGSPEEQKSEGSTKIKESETQEAANLRSSEDKVDIKLIKSEEDSMDAIHEFTPAEFPTVAVPYASEAVEKNDADLSTSTSIEVPVKDLKVEFGSPDEHKSEGSTKTKEPSSNVTTIYGGCEVLANVVEEKDEDLEEKIRISVERHVDLESKPKLRQTPSDEGDCYVGVEVQKENEIIEPKAKLPQLAIVSSKEEKASEASEDVDKNKDDALEDDNKETSVIVAKVLLGSRSVLVGDKFIEKETNVNAEAVERDWVHTFIDHIEAEASSELVKAHETTEIIKAESDKQVLGLISKIIKAESDKQVLGLISKKLNISSEASEVPSEMKVSAGDEKKSESLKDEVATSVEAPKIITTEDDSLDVPPHANVSSEDDKVSEPAEVVEKNEEILEGDNNDTALKEEPGGDYPTRYFGELQSLDRPLEGHAEEKKAGNDNKDDGEEIIFLPNEASGKDGTDNNEEEGLRGTASTTGILEENHEPDDVSVSDETKKEERHENVGEETNSLQESVVSNSSEPTVETNEGKMQTQANGAHEMPSEVQDKSSEFVQSSAFHEPVISESKAENKKKPDARPLVSSGFDASEDGNLEFETQEAANLGSSKDKVDIELVKSEDSMDAVQQLAPAEFSTVVVPYTSEAPERNDADSSTSTSIEVPVKDLEVESGSPKEQKSEASTKTKEPSSNVTTIDGRGEDLADVVEEKDEDLEDKIRISVEIHEDLESKPKLPQTPSDEGNGSVGIEVMKDNAIVEAKAKLPPHASVSSEEEKASEACEEDKNKDDTLEDDSNDTALKVAKVLLGSGSVLVGDKLVDKGKNVNAEAVERDWVDTFIDYIEDEVSSDLAKAHETTEIVKEGSDKEVLGLKSEELNISPEASEVPSERDRFYAGDDERNESLKAAVATSVEAPRIITTVDDSLDDTPPHANVSSEEEKGSEPGEVAEKNEETLEGGSNDTALKVAKVLFEGRSNLEGDKLVDKEKNVYADAVERDLVDTFIDHIETEISSQLVIPPETTEIVEEESDKNVLGVKWKELNIFPEASEVPPDGDKVFAGDEGKSESFIGENATSVEAPKSIATMDESLVQTIEEKSESSNSEVEAPTEDKLVDKEEDVNVEAEKRDLVDTSTYLTATVVSSEHVKTPETAGSVNDGIDKDALKVTTKELNIALEACEVPYGDGDKVSTGDEKKSESLKGEEATLVETPEYITTTKESLDQVIEEKNEISTNAPTDDKLVDKAKDVNVEVKKRDLVDTSVDPTADKVSSKNVKAPETAEIVKDESSKEALEVTTNELNIAPEVSEVPSVGDKVSADNEEKSESLKNEATFSVEAPKDVTILEESLDQVIEEEKKSDISKSETDTQDKYKLADKVKYVIVEAEGRDVIDTSTYPTATKISYEQVKSPKTFEIVKERNKQAFEVTSKELNITPEASEVPSEGDIVSSGDEKKSETLRIGAITSVESQNDIITISEESLDQVIEEEKKSEISKSGTNTLADDKLVDMEEHVNVEAEERNLIDTSTYPTATEVSHEQVKSAKISVIVEEESDKQALEATSMELNIIPEASEVPSKGDKYSAGDEEKNECLEGEDATSVEVPIDISTTEESLDLVVEEKKDVSSKSEMEALTEDKLVDKEKDVNAEDAERYLVDTFTNLTASEVSSKQIKAPVTAAAIVMEESDKKALEVTSKDLNIDPEVSYAGDKVSAHDEEKNEILKEDVASSVEAPKDITTSEESLEQVIEEHKSDSLKSETKALIEDKLAEKEKDVEVVAEERKLIDKSTDLTAAEVSSEQARGLETIEIAKEESNKEALEVSSKELMTAPEAIEAPSESDEEKSESFKSEAATLMEADQVIEEKRESPKNEMSAPSKHKLVDMEKDVNVDAEEGDLVDTSADSSAVEASSKKVKSPATVEAVKEESDKEALKVTFKELNIASEAIEVSSESYKVSAGDVEMSESLKSEAATSMEADQVIEDKIKSSKSEMAAPSKDKLVDKEKDVNVDAEEGDLFDASTVSTAFEVSSKQVKAPETSEIVKEESDKDVLEVTSKKLNIVPEASEVPSKGVEISASNEEKSESSKGEDVSFLEAPKYVTTAEESLHEAIGERKNESSKSERGAPVQTTKDFDTSELSSKAVKDIIASEMVDERKEETSKGLNVQEKEANNPEDKKEEVKADEAVQNAIDKPVQEDLGAEKEVSAIADDQDLVVYSDTKDAKLIKEVTKRESNIFSKLKRSIAKAKKAILRKSPGAKHVIRSKR